jgi:DNA-binding XRE family transcriptional regulator
MAKRHARLLRVLRAEQDITQTQLAAKAGIAPFRYWQIEHSQGAPMRPSEHLAIAKALGVHETEIAWTDALKAKAS